MVNKMKNIHVLEQKVLDMLPIKQADMWKNLGINNQDGSALTRIMLDENLIKRTKLNRTFLLERKFKCDNKRKNPLLLSEKGNFSPCVGCKRSCEPPKCDLLAEWLT